MSQAQGTKGLLSIQYEDAFGADPSLPDLTKVYYESEGFKASKNLISSNILTGSRHATAPISGNIDVQGSIATELQSGLANLFYGAMGSIKSTVTTIGAEGYTGSATITACSSVLGAVAATQTMILAMTPTAHLFVVGDTLLFGTGGTINAVDVSTYRFRVIAQSTGSVTVRVPLGLAGALVVGTPGNIKKVSTGGTAYTHEIKSGGLIPSFVVEKGFPDLATPQYFKYNGCKIGKMSLGVAPEGFQKLSFDFTGKKETIGTATFDATVIDLLKNSFAGSDIAVGAVIEDVGGANTALASVTKCDISLENSLDTGIYVVGGAGTRGDIPVGLTKVTGTLECLFDSITLYTKAVASTESSLKITYAKGTGAGSLGNEALEILLPELIFKQDTPVIAGDKGILVSLPFETYYTNNSDTTQLKITIKTPQYAV